MSEVIDKPEVIEKPDALTKSIVTNAIKSAQDFAKKNAEEPDKWLVDWAIYCGPILLDRVTARAKKIGENEWEGIEEIVFRQGSACMLTAHPRWMSRGSDKIDLRKVLGQGQCVANIKIKEWAVRLENGEVSLQVRADGDVPGS